MKIANSALDSLRHHLDLLGRIDSNVFSYSSISDKESTLESIPSNECVIAFAYVQMDTGKDIFSGGILGVAQNESEKFIKLMNALRESQFEIPLHAKVYIEGINYENLNFFFTVPENEVEFTEYSHEDLQKIWEKNQQ